jgi:hypothetical protein
LIPGLSIGLHPDFNKHIRWFGVGLGMRQPLAQLENPYQPQEVHKKEGKVRHKIHIPIHTHPPTPLQQGSYFPVKLNT